MHDCILLLTGKMPLNTVGSPKATREVLFAYFRMMPNSFYYNLGEISYLILKNSNFRICVFPDEEKLRITLR